MRFVKAILAGILFLGCREPLKKESRFGKVFQDKVEVNTCSEWQSGFFQKMHEDFPNSLPIDRETERIEVDAVIGNCPVVLFRLIKDSLFLHSHKAMVSDMQEFSLEDSAYIKKIGERTNSSISVSLQSGEDLWNMSKALIDSIRCCGSKSSDENIAFDGFAIRVRFLSSRSNESWCTHSKLGEKESQKYSELVKTLLRFEQSGFGKFIRKRCEM